MRRLKRFGNWLGYVYFACWAFSRRFVADSSPAEERAAEVGHSAVVDAPVAESDSTMSAERSDAQSELFESSIATASAPVASEQVETVKPMRQVEDKPAALPVEQVAAKPATPSEKILQEPTVDEKERVAPIAEPRKVFTPAPKVAEVPKPRFQKPRLSAPPASQSPVACSPVSGWSPKTQAPLPQQAPQAPPANVKSQGTNGATASPSSGKYDPGAVNDQTAQRLARLLVSEIKLYHKSKTDGENGSDLINIYDMLKDPIDKSRQHYKARMGEKAIKTMPDYFHGELVRSLCGGDPSRLGPNYQA